MSATIQNRLAAGLCRDCGGPPTPGKQRCEDCRKAHNAKVAEYQKKKREAGLVVRYVKKEDLTVQDKLPIQVQSTLLASRPDGVMALTIQHKTGSMVLEFNREHWEQLASSARWHYTNAPAINKEQQKMKESK